MLSILILERNKIDKIFLISILVIRMENKISRMNRFYIFCMKWILIKIIIDIIMNENLE